MSSSTSRPRHYRTIRRLGLLAISGIAIGYAAEAFAIDRAPFPGGSVSDARPGYGSERSGYGAERQYYGAENIRSNGRRDGYGHPPRYRTEGSFIEFRDDAYEEFEDGGIAGFEPATSRGGVFPGFGGTSVGSITYYGDEDTDWNEGFDPEAAGRARVIDVASERLDRTPIGPSGVSVSYGGTTKIIRIASHSPAASPLPAKTAAPALEPWSDAWQRYCKRAHPGFDPARGTFTAADGAARFCTGD